MATKINVAITTKSGLEIPAGAVVTYNIIFPSRAKAAELDLMVYKDEASLDTNERVRELIEGIPSVVSVEFTKAQLTGANNPLPLIELTLKNKIEESVGVGNCEIIDVIPEDLSE